MRSAVRTGGAGAVSGAAQPLYRPRGAGERRDGGVPCEEHGALPGAADAGGRGISGAGGQPPPKNGV